MKITHLVFLALIFIIAIACESEKPAQSQPTAQTTVPVKNTKTSTKAGELTLQNISHFLAPDQQNEDLKIVVGEKFGLRQDQKAVLESDGMTAVLQKIADSRCPPNVTCIRAGEITVVLGITEKEKERAAILTYPTKEKPQSKDNMNIGNYNIKFLGAVQQKDDKKADKKEKLAIGKEKDLLLGFVMQRAKSVVK